MNPLAWQSLAVAIGTVFAAAAGLVGYDLLIAGGAVFGLAVHFWG